MTSATVPVPEIDLSPDISAPVKRNKCIRWSTMDKIRLEDNHLKIVLPVHPPMHNGIPAPQGRAGFGATMQAMVSAAANANINSQAPQARSVHQPADLGINASARIVPSGTNISYNQEMIQKPHDERSLSDEPRLTSLDQTISEVGLNTQQQPQPPPPRPQEAGMVLSVDRIDPLRGPSLENAAQRPVVQAPTHGNAAEGTNKLLTNKLQNSVPMDANGTPNVTNQRQNGQPNWSIPRTMDSVGHMRLGHDGLATEAAKTSSATRTTSGTQTVSNDEGRMMSAGSWAAPRNNSNGSLHYGRQSLPNQGASSSTQNTSNDEGRMMSADPWAAPINNSNGSLHYGRQSLPNQGTSSSTQNTSNDEGRLPSQQNWSMPRSMQNGGSLHLGQQNLLNQSVETVPNAAQSDLSQPYRLPSGAYEQRGAQLLVDPQRNMAMADGGADGLQIIGQVRTSFAGNSVPPNRRIFNNSTHAISQRSQSVPQPSPSGSNPIAQASVSPQASLAIGHRPPLQIVSPLNREIAIDATE
ncbi:uncharacterized protein [Amphiura filiformis]|uniref:uncharacterized protein isoform X2 n=1 Tax=Amphiura filiformis TaxID=82378 RepID=UPI003B20FB1E